MHFESLGFNEEGITSFRYMDQIVQNPFEVGLQAMLGEDVTLPYEKTHGIMITRYIPLRYIPDPSENVYARKAMKWIREHEDTRIQGLSLWYYQFDTVFFAHKIKAPWISAFGQSYILLALLLWYQYTKQDIYRDMALRAAQALITPVNEGGLMKPMADGYWFEELPPPADTEIFNGHLVAVLALAEAQRILDTKRFAHAIEEGLRAFEYHIRYMDTGFWSTYDIPDKASISIQLIPFDAGKSVCLKQISLSCGEIERRIDLSDDRCFSFTEKDKITGVDWGKVDASGYRALAYGPKIHSFPVETGTRQNTYAHFEYIPVMAPVLTLMVEAFCNESTEVAVAVIDQNGNWRTLGGEKTLHFSHGFSETAISFPISLFFPRLTMLYHDYHILLLEEILQHNSNQKIRLLCEQLRKYKQDDLKNSSRVATVPMLQDLHINVNEYCGEGNHFGLDPMLIIQRCIECDSLRCVHVNARGSGLWIPLVETIKTLKSIAKLKVNVTMNDIDSKVLQEVFEAGLDELWVSIDDFEQTKDSIYGVQGLWCRVADALRDNADLIMQYKKRGLKLYLSCTISPLNYLHLRELIESLNGLGFDMFKFMHMNYIGKDTVVAHNSMYKAYPIEGSSVVCEDCLPNTINPYLMWLEMNRVSQYCHLLNIPFDFAPKMETVLDYEDFYYRPSVVIGKNRCSVPHSTMEVNVDGSCCVLSQCYKLELGNIHKHGLNEIFHSWVMDTFRSQLEERLMEPCKRCYGIMK